MATSPISCELIGDAPAARAALQRPLQRLLVRIVRGAAEGLQPVLDDREVLVLVERVERDPQAEALGKRDFLLHGLARMDLVAHVARLEVLRHVFGHQVAPVGRGADEEIVGGGRNGAVERHLERDVSVLGAVEREIVAEKKEALLARRDATDVRRKDDEVVLPHLDQPHALPGILVEQALHDRGFTGAARAGEEHVVRGLAVDELTRVLLAPVDLFAEAAQARKPDLVHVPPRLQPACSCTSTRGAAAGGGAPAEGHARIPVGLRRRWRKKLAQPLQDFFEVFAHRTSVYGRRIYVLYSALIFT